MRQLSVRVIALFALIAQDSTIRASTRLVEVDVVAHKHSGKAISDLTKNDFTVYYGHLRQSVSVVTATFDVKSLFRCRRE
jgi:hypothetical protein